jgi:hypothetical protein
VRKKNFVRDLKSIINDEDACMLLFMSGEKVGELKLSTLDDKETTDDVINKFERIFIGKHECNIVYYINGIGISVSFDNWRVVYL